MRFLVGAYPELKGLSTSTKVSENGFSVGVAVTKKTRAGDQVTLAVDAQVSRGRLATFMADGPHVHIDALEQLAQQWSSEPEISADRVDHDLAALGARFTSGRGRELLASALPHLRRELGELRAGTPRLKWRDDHQRGRPVTTPLWWFVAEVRRPDGPPLCYNLALEPIDGRILSLAEISHGLYGSSDPEECVR